MQKEDDGVYLYSAYFDETNRYFHSYHEEDGRKDYVLIAAVPCGSTSITPTSPFNTSTAQITERTEVLVRQRTVSAPIRLSK